MFFVSDCSGGMTAEGHEDAKARMTQAGAKPVCWLAVTAEWVPDYLMPERQVISKVATKRAGSYSLQIEYVMTQVEAGLVRPPSWMSAPASLAGTK